MSKRIKITQTEKPTTPASTNNQSTQPALSQADLLVDVHGLLSELWPDAQSRPSARWLRERQRKREIPFIKLGGSVFFIPRQVRDELEKRSRRVL